MKPIIDYLKEAENLEGDTDQYSQNKLEEQFKKYAEDLIDWMAYNWSPIIVEYDTGIKRFTYTSFEECKNGFIAKTINSIPPDNLSMGRETFEVLKKYIK